MEKFTDDQGAGGMTATGMRPATAADEEYCFQLHKAAMGAYITQIWGWDEDVQRDFHARAFSPGRWQIITVDSADAGMDVLAVNQRAHALYRRMGLHEVARHGKNDIKIRMSTKPPLRGPSHGS
ncbi:hypothetical protein RI578_38675 [Streptomyces sp. BB1-1-1]|uniref:hypothetical protein n=1 Tax=Streptomyces sp. BB1-1-1 TaxID=3074430 RepID=UPI0028772A15|nr:hypothetical protein [Streptomyces sp. BB1-1-1]WND39855.1 hypothetical protein RI578_38675 [Streptomyces sp. BB1-1-1]